MQHENETFSVGGTITCRLELAGQNVRIADPVIGQEAVGRVVFAQSWWTSGMLCPMALRICFSKFADSVAEPRAPNFASTTLWINPTFTFQGPKTVLISDPESNPRERGAQQGITSDSFRFKISPLSGSARVVKVMGN